MKHNSWILTYECYSVEDTQCEELHCTYYYFDEYGNLKKEEEQK